MAKIVTALEEAIQREDAGALIEYYFGIRLRRSQARLAAVIAFRTEDRIAVTAATQTGKTFTVAAAVMLALLLHEGLRVAIIAPTYAKTRILQGYCADILVRSPHLQALIDHQTTGVDSLRREATKTRVTFKDGGEIHFHSCEGDAMRLMGFGSYDLVVEEEAGETPDDVERTKITRMTSKTGCVRVKIGNPWHKHTHFHRACRNPRWTTFRWSLDIALKEGAFTKAFIQERREELTPAEFQVLYEARFPDSIGGGLIPDEDLDAALEQKPPEEGRIESVGVDVAEAGDDFTVATRIKRAKDGSRGAEQLTIEHGDPEDQVQRFADWMGDERDAPVRYDAVGVGSAWGPLLRQHGFRAIPVKWPEAPRDKTRFAKSKSEQYWHLRSVLTNGLLSLKGTDPRLPPQLRAPTYEHTPAGKIEVKVPGRKTGEKSPDHADSVVLAVIPLRVGGRPRIEAW